MLVGSVEDIAETVRRRRLETGMSQIDLAEAAGVGPRFVVELEGAKPTLRLNLVIQVLAQLGIPLHVGDPPAARHVDDGDGLDLPEQGGGFDFDVDLADEGGFRP